MCACVRVYVRSYVRKCTSACYIRCIRVVEKIEYFDMLVKGCLAELAC